MNTQNDWAKEIQFNLENLIVDIGVQVTDDYKDKNGLYEGMSIKNVRSRDKYKKIFTKLLADARKDEATKTMQKVRKMLAFEGVLSMSVEKGFDELLATLRKEQI